MLLSKLNKEMACPFSFYIQKVNGLPIEPYFSISEGNTFTTPEESRLAERVGQVAWHFLLLKNL